MGGTTSNRHKHVERRSKEICFQCNEPLGLPTLVPNARYASTRQVLQLLDEKSTKEVVVPYSENLP